LGGVKEKKYADTLLKEIGISSNKVIIGISPGAGKVFAKKAWKPKKYVQLIDKLNHEFKDKIEIILLGGAREVEIVNEIKEEVSTTIFDAGCNNSLGDFIGVVDNCHIVISGDTLAMHLAIGLKKMVLAMFGPTCHQEIELYGRGEKIIAKIGCAPCYKGKCDIEDDCMESISLDEVYIKVKEIIVKQLATL
jgi:heptosyltransferase-2